MQCLSKDPDHRPASALEIANTLDELRGRAGVASAAAPQPKSIAVLPFANLSSDPENEYLADGIAEEIINALAKLEGLRVAARTSTLSFRGQHIDVRRAGAQLNVATVLEGSVRRAGNRLRVTAQLINAEDGYHLWSERYDRELQDVFAIQDEISLAIVETLKVKLAASPQQQLGKARTTNLAAYNLFLQGRYYWNQRGAGLAQAAECFRQAIDIDPTYAPAHSALADSYSLQGWWRQTSPAQSFPKALAEARTAVSLDDNLAEAHVSLAFARMCYEWAWDDAAKEFRRGLELNRGYPTGHHWYAEYLLAKARTDDAIAEARRAQELDPLGLVINVTVGLVSYYSRRYSEAIAESARTIAMEPAFVPGYVWLGLAYLGAGRPADAIGAFEKEQRLSGESAVTTAYCGIAYARNGQQDKSEQTLARLLSDLERGRYVAALDIAQLQLALNRRPEALDWLERAYRERSVMLGWIAVDPLLDDLRNEDRFAAVSSAIAAGRLPNPDS
jgi:serine/threonine-protein kinase